MTELEAPRGIAFDLDGTLVDTVGARIDGWLEALDAVGLPATRDEIAPMIGIDGKELARRVAASHGHRLDEEAIEAIDRSAGEAFDRLNSAPRPLPGARELLAAVEEAGIPWVVATSSRAEQVKRSVAALGLGEPPTIVDGSQVEHAKPEPDLLLLAAERLGAAPEDCWAVGDATWDIRASIAAGVTPIGVLAGSAVDRAALEDAGAALVVESLDELIPRLGGRSRTPG